MSYNAETYRHARRVIEERRQNAVARAEERTRVLHSALPRLAEIDRALAATGRKIFGEACRGGEDLPERIDALKRENEALVAERKALLTKNGYDENETEVNYTCMHCLDTGFVDTRMCECLRKEMITEGMRRSGLGGLIDRQSFENFSLSYYAASKENLALARYAYDTAKEYADTFRVGERNLLFIGGTGLGKTHLSTAIARRVIEKGFYVLYESAQNIFSDFEYDRFRARGDEAPRAEKYFSADLLILDDLGTEMMTQFSVSCLYNLLSTRLNRGKSTVVSTNLDERGIRDAYDDRITSRLFGEFQVLLFRGEDVRKQKL